MSTPKQKIETEDVYALHEFYMAIINSVPNIMYWVDIECHLQGCNQAFVQLLGLTNLKDFKGTPYDQMKQVANWDDKRIEEFRLDDMQVLFSGNAQYKKEEQLVINKQGVALYFQSTRVPIYDKAKKITGLIVTLTDVSSNKIHEEQVKPQPLIETALATSFIDGYLPSILMVEDNLIAQCVEKALLTSLHCRVDIADSEAHALKLFNPGKYDLVLMDIGLEDTSGYLVAKKLRQKEKNTQFHVPIIALTSYDAEAVKADCEQYFMEGAITKPLTSEQAEQMIKHYVYHIDIPIQGLKHS